MSPFEFFFSFYGLLLGFSVAEVVGGFARMLHDRKHVRIGWATPMLAVFVAFDIATFWVQAWIIFRNAPFNLALLILGLVVASVFYVAATLVFPRDVREHERLDDHFEEHRRLILLCLLAANLIMFAAFLIFGGAVGEIGRLFSVKSMIGTAFFMLATLGAALTPSRRVAVVLLGLLLTYQSYGIVLNAIALAHQPWSLVGKPAAAAEQ